MTDDIFLRQTELDLEEGVPHTSERATLAAYLLVFRGAAFASSVPRSVSTVRHIH